MIPRGRMFRRRTTTILIVFLVVLSASSVFFIKSKHLKKTEQVKASSGSTSITTDDNWNAGTLSNVAVASGSLSVNSGTSPLDLNAMYQADNSRVTATPNSGTRGNAIDGNTGTAWSATLHPDEDMTWTMNFDATYSVAKVRAHTFQDSGSWGFALAVYDGSWHSLGNYMQDGVGTWREQDVNSNISAISLTFHVGALWGGDVLSRINEIEVISNGAGTHISASTQIDGSEGATKNFISWETFTPTYTEPANTNVKFRFKTSPDHATWTSWSGYQTPASGAAFDISAIVDSASGVNKYLQVETTLENTDGVSTPSVDSYSAAYHTDVKPDKPTAATAVVQ